MGKYEDISKVRRIAAEWTLQKQAIALLEEILNSDMAMREEDEGQKSPILKKVRKFLKELKS